MTKYNTIFGNEELRDDTVYYVVHTILKKIY